MNQMKRIHSIIIGLSFGLITAFAQDLNDNQIYLEGNTDKAYTLFSGKQWARDELNNYRFYLAISQDVFLFKIMHEGVLPDAVGSILKQYAGKTTTARIQFADGYSANYDVLIENTTDPKFSDTAVKGITYIIDPYSGNSDEAKEKNSEHFIDHDISRITVNGLTDDIKGTSDIKSSKFFMNLVYQYSIIESKKK